MVITELEVAKRIGTPTDTGDTTVFGKENKIIKEWRTIQLCLPGGSNKTIDLTGLKGTLKSAFVTARAGVNGEADTSVYVSLTWEGNTVCSNSLIANCGDATDSNGTGSGCLVIDITDYLVMDSVNTYTFLYTNSNPYPSTFRWWTSKGVLTITYIPD